MSLIGIDLSETSTSPDHLALRRAGVGFAIIRASVGVDEPRCLPKLPEDPLKVCYLPENEQARPLHTCREDKMLEENFSGFTNAGVGVAVYHELHAKNVLESICEADALLGIIRAREISPIFVACSSIAHYERDRALDRLRAAKLCDAFCRRIATVGGLETCICTNELLPGLDAKSFLDYHEHSSDRKYALRFWSIAKKPPIGYEKMLDTLEHKKYEVPADTKVSRLMIRQTKRFGAVAGCKGVYGLDVSTELGCELEGLLLRSAPARLFELLLPELHPNEAQLRGIVSSLKRLEQDSPGLISKLGELLYGRYSAIPLNTGDPLRRLSPEGRLMQLKHRTSLSFEELRGIAELLQRV